MCQRRERHSIMNEDTRNSTTIRALPHQIAQRLIEQPVYSQWSVLKLLQMALHFEGALSASSSYNASSSRKVFQVGHAPDKPCNGCSGKHLRRDYSYKKTRCTSCNRIGHTLAACKSVVTHDTAGIKRIVSEPNAVGIKTQVTLDNTQPAQVKVTTGVIDKTLAKNQAIRSKARNRYKTKRVVFKDSLKPENLEEGEVSKDEQMIQEDPYVDDARQASHLVMHASLPSSCMVQPTSSPSISSHDMTTVNAWINDIETIVTLDTAFCIDMMSQLTAS